MLKASQTWSDMQQACERASCWSFAGRTQNGVLLCVWHLPRPPSGGRACVQVRQSLEQFASTSGGAGSKPDVLQENVVVRPHLSCVRACCCGGYLSKALC